MNRRRQIFKIKQQGIGYNRNRVDVWVDDYGIDAVSWMLENGYLKCSDKLYRGESPIYYYYEFTFKGVWLHRWHSESVFGFLYYYVFHLYEIRLWWQRLMTRFGRRYAWQEYDGVEPKDI